MKSTFKEVIGTIVPDLFKAKAGNLPRLLKFRLIVRAAIAESSYRQIGHTVGH